MANPGGPYTGNVGQTIAFDGSKSSAPSGQTLAYAWNFGDSSTGTGVSPTHAYSAAGTFTVSLTVTDTVGGTNALSTTATISALPVANPGGPYTGNIGQTIAFDGSKSTAPSGQTLTYAWNFGDNATGTGVSPTHAYSAAGTFTVSLTVTDTVGGTNALSTTATISALPVANPGGPYTGNVGQTIAFDGSKSSAPSGQTLTYAWNFGDNSTGTGVSPTHAYSAAGTFTVSLTVTDTIGGTNALSTTATISALPVANPGGPYTGNVGQTITFDGSKSTAPSGQTLTYAWNFGDNATGTGVSPTHAYSAAGTFTVSLTVTDTAGGTNTASTTATIAAIPLPVANPGGPYSGTVGQTITFDGSKSTAPSGQTLTYAWNFGDNATGTGVSPTHAYSAAGTFTVSLTVTDTSGDTNTNTTTATIGSGAAPTITSFTPTSGPVGTQVTISGTNFVPSPQVMLAQQGGGSIGASVVMSTGTSIVFIVPTGAATGPLTVTVGSQSATSATSFTVVASSSFTVNAAPSTANLIQGQSVTYSVSLSSTNGFTQLAALSVSGLPTGLTATFSPNQITAGQSSMLTVTAPAGQATGSSTLTVMAAATVQGIALSPTASVMLNVQGVSTSFLGRTVVDDSRESPIAGVTIKFLGVDDKGNVTGCAGQTVSDAGGNFLLSSLPAACVGPQLISYDGSTATAPPGKYAGVNLSYTFTSGQVTTSPVLVHLPRIDNGETVSVQQNAPVDQVFKFQTIPSLAVTVYAGTTFTLDDGTQPNPFPLIALSIPIDRLPDQMPTSGMLTPFIVAFQPANAVASQPVAVNFPNPLNSPPGTAATFMTLDPTHGYMVPYGTGTVSRDGTQFIPDADPTHPGHSYGLVHFDWHGPRGPAPNANLGDDRAGDPVDLSTGQFVLNKTDIALGSARGTVKITRTYRSSTSNVGPFGVGTGHNYGYLLDVANFVQGIGTVLTLDMPNGNQYPFAQQGQNTFASSATPRVLGAVITTSSGSTGTYDLRWKDGTVFHFQTSSLGGLLAFLNSITDPNGNVTTLVRGNSSQPSQITQIIDPVGRALNFTYDSLNRITSITDPIGRQVQYTYNSLGGLATVTDPAGGVTTYTYAPTIPASALALDSITDPRGITYLKNSYIAFLVAQQTAADGGVTNYDFDGFIACTKIPNNRSGCFHEGPYFNASVTDPLGHHYAYHFNVQGFLQDVTDPLGQQTVYNRDPLTNELLTVTDPMGRTTGFTYDSSGNMTSLTQLAGTPGAVTTSFTYDPISSNVISVTDPLGNVTTASYDNVGNLLSITDPLGDQFSSKYDPQGEPIAWTDPLGNTTQVEYQNGQLARITDPLNRVVTRVLDGAGRPIAITNPLGQTTQYQYNAQGQVTQITGPLGNQTSFSYDGNGNTLTVTDALQHTNSFSYDVMDRLAAHTDPLGNSESVQRDLNGNITQFTDRRGVIATYTYDQLERPTSANFGGGQEVVNYTYDVGNRLTQVTDSLTGNINRTYDNLNRLTQEVTPQGSISYGFDADGRRTTMAASGQAPVSYSYDSDSRLSQITQGASTVGFSYDIDGRRTALTLPNGVTVAYTYDAASQLTGIAYNSGSKVLGSLAYTYDLNAQRVQVGGSFAQTGMPSALSSANYNANNQLTSAGTGALTYDASGNLTNDGVNRYTWDARNRLVSISGAIAANFQYDIFGRRISSTMGGTKQYLYDGLNPVEELSGGTPSANLLTGLTVDEYFQRTDPNSIASFLSDALGSTIALTDPNGNLSSQYTYDPFGNTTVTGSSANPFQYAGRENDGTNLYFYRARYYNPTFGRFISEDPIGFTGGDVNLYRYVWNSPTNFIDPLGEAGAGVAFGGSAEGGVVIGAGAQGSAGIGGFVNNTTNVDNLNPSVGEYVTGGAFAGGPKFGVSAPSKPGDVNGVVGGFFGLGWTAWATNATSVCDLSGPFKTATIQGGWFAKVGGAQFSWGHNAAGHFIGVVNWGFFGSLPTGIGWGASASLYNTTTSAHTLAGRDCGC